MRIDNRLNDQLRPVKITRNFIKHAEGSVLIEFGDTKVICTATLDDKVPPFKKGTGEGWLTAEYAMLPRSTHTRKPRDISRLKMDSRSQEIQRLIGRALRSIVDFKKLGELNIIIDCDVMQADGGTRTSSINGGYIALVDCVNSMINKGIIKDNPIVGSVAAISVGLVKGVPMLDLCYHEDSDADVDMNVVMNDKGEFIEIQGTGENTSFSKEQMSILLDLAENGIKEVQETQKKAFSE